MKRILKPLLLLLVLNILVWGGYQLFRPDSPDQIAEDQIELMQDALLSLENFNSNGDAQTTIDKLETLATRYTDLLARRKKLSKKANEVDGKLISEIEKLGGELVNESLEVEISGKSEAAEVAAAFEKFSNQ